MPRPLPVFEEYEKMFQGMKIEVDKNKFNKNTKIVIYCNNGHTYITSITKINSLKQDYRTCPHCSKENKYNEKRIASKEIEDTLINTTFSLYNKKEYYKRWEDKIELICNNDNNIEEIKSINYWIENGKKPPKCSKCLEKKVLSDAEFKKELDRITNNVYNFDIKLGESKYNSPLTESSIKIIQKHNWHIEEFNGTKRKSKFICKTCGYKKETLVLNLRGCLQCEKHNLKNGVKQKLKDICETNNLFITQQEIYKDVSSPIKFKCNSCSHDFENSWAEITGKIYNLHCPNCYNSIKRKSQTEVLTFIKGIYSGLIEENNKTLISPKEIDLFIPEKKIAIEYCGNIWHSEKFGKDKNYHYEKYINCLKQGVSLITIFEDEWKHRTEICKSRLKSLLICNTEKIYARECVIKTVETDKIKEFMEDNHLQGYTHADVHIGLYYNNEMVSAMSFKDVKGSQNTSDWDLIRFVNKMHTSVIGGASKILNNFKSDHKGKTLSTYSDSRWCDGSFYEKIGFKHVHDIDPGYYYVGAYTKWRLKHRFTFKKERLMEIFKETDSTKTEHQIALEHELYRIYDCGHKKYEMIM